MIASTLALEPCRRCGIDLPNTSLLSYCRDCRPIARANGDELALDAATVTRRRRVYEEMPHLERAAREGKGSHAAQYIALLRLDKARQQMEREATC